LQPALGAPPSPHVELTADRLQVDGAATPYLYGAELQYFRARGGAGRNVPADRVEKLWNRMIDRVLEAKMNTVSFYIPWDFHEPVEGLFDFDGRTIDQDHDGHPDYPSRNLKGFLKLLIARGIRHILIRPGPYINAEWGPTGFGAIPRWFLEKYPEAVAMTGSPGKPKTANFAHPIYRERVQRWFTALYQQVLKDYLGPGSPIVVLQLDNETNFFWDSIYERDFSPLFLSRYRAYLAKNYVTIDRLNSVYGSRFTSYDQVDPPRAPDDNRYPGPAWHYDWFLAHDHEILDYYHFLRQTWETLGVREPTVLFTSCDSFNAPDHGLLPRLDFRAKGQLSLTTMNIYPKTDGSHVDSTLNVPMKAAHDATLIAQAHRQFYGNAGNWVMTTETVGGWFPPTEVSLAARQHTYGSLVGGGIKAMILYYFHEGYNWDGLEKNDSELNFDAPLDKEMNPKPRPVFDKTAYPANTFELVKETGRALDGRLGALAVDSSPVLAPVLIAHDSQSQYPIPAQVDALRVASTESAALYGLFREAGAQPTVAFLEAMTDEELAHYRLVVWNSPGYLKEPVRKRLNAYLQHGGTLLFIGGEDAGLHPGRGTLVRRTKSPAEGWNSDEYPRLPRAAEQLADARGLLARAGVRVIADVAAVDGKPFLHAWLRRQPTTGNLLLFVENFLRESREARVRISHEVIRAANWLRFSPLLTARPFAGGGPPIDLTGETLEKEGIRLPVNADGIDIWEIEKRK
jgi:beta-galactosidase GanA